MQRLAFAAIASFCLVLSSCLDNDFPVLYDTYVDIWLRDEQGNNLLNPTVDGHFDYDAIKLFYLRDDDTLEVFHSRSDAPRNFTIMNNTFNGEFFLRLLPDEGKVNNDETITLIEWKPGVTDELRCIVGRTPQAVFVKNAWYNDDLRFDIDYTPAVNWGNQVMVRFIEVRK